MYAIKVSSDGRCLSAVDPTKCTAVDVAGMPVVAALPDGNLSDWLYVDGSYVYDPQPVPEETESADNLEARVAELEEALELLLSGVTE